MSMENILKKFVQHFVLIFDTFIKGMCYKLL